LRNKLGIGQQALQQQVENAMQEAIACAAEATDDRRLVPLWTEQPEKGPMVYHKIAKACAAPCLGKGGSTAQVSMGA
jgi:hypothetical protein